VRIERIRVEGFGALRGLDLAWPEGRVLLAVDPNETGKTTLCEAIVTALYGLPKTRGVATRLRELRRPRSGAPMRVGLDVAAGGRSWSIDRDLDAGTLRIVDRDRGLDATPEFLRPGGKDVFGETVTGGLGETLFRATAYVKQNVLDTDRLEAGLTVELARIADSGGGEASVVRALRALEETRREMPGATTGGAVSVDTEIARLGKRIEALKARRDALAQKRREAAQVSAALAHRTRARDEARAREALLRAADESRAVHAHADAVQGGVGEVGRAHRIDGRRRHEDVGGRHPAGQPQGLGRRVARVGLPARSISRAARPASASRAGSASRGDSRSRSRSCHSATRTRSSGRRRLSEESSTGCISTWVR